MSLLIKRRAGISTGSSILKKIYFHIIKTVHFGKNFYLLFKSNAMEENNDFMENNDLIPHMKSLSSLTNKMVLNGYDDDFKITDKGLKSLKTEKIYQPEQINIINFLDSKGSQIQTIILLCM